MIEVPFEAKGAVGHSCVLYPKGQAIDFSKVGGLFTGRRAFPDGLPRETDNGYESYPGRSGACGFSCGVHAQSDEYSPKED